MKNTFALFDSYVTKITFLPCAFYLALESLCNLKQFGTTKEDKLLGIHIIKMHRSNIPLVINIFCYYNVSCLFLNFYKEFIMLENLVAPYRFPCVMDLKMGTSHRSPDASEAKRRMLEERWMSTTSSSLGFRMCGIQVRFF